jgi:hypothetical protein
VATVGYRFVCKVEVSEDDSGALKLPASPIRLEPVADKALGKDLKPEQESTAEASQDLERVPDGIEQFLLRDQPLRVMQQE